MVQQLLPADMPELKPFEAKKKLAEVMEEKKFDYVIRCPRCRSFYPNPVPKTAPGGSVLLKCKPSKKWGGRRPPVPKGEKGEWCGMMFRLNVEEE